MKLLKRIGYYLIGVSLGSIVVLFIWKGKETTFDYGPNARTLKSIRKKVITYDSLIGLTLEKHAVDSLQLQNLLINGSVDFGKSKARLKPCAEYFITSELEEKTVELYIQRCDSVATIQKLVIN